MKNLADLKQEFTDTVNTSHIAYSWDAGHAYSYIEHPLMWEDVSHLSYTDQDEFQCFTDAWLYENDACPPCQPGCCDEHMSPEEKEEVIVELMSL